MENLVVREDEYGEECTEQWREYATYTVMEFFAKLIREFEELELVRSSFLLLGVKCLVC